VADDWFFVSDHNCNGLAYKFGVTKYWNRSYGGGYTKWISSGEHERILGKITGKEKNMLDALGNPKRRRS